MNEFLVGIEHDRFKQKFIHIGSFAKQKIHTLHRMPFRQLQEICDAAHDVGREF